MRTRSTGSNPVLTTKTNNMKQQTAVDWLVNKIYRVIPNEERNFLEGLKDEAKQMEKEQTVKSWHNGYANQSPMIDEANCGQTYYNETYSK